MGDGLFNREWVNVCIHLKIYIYAYIYVHINIFNREWVDVYIHLYIYICILINVMDPKTGKVMQDSDDVNAYVKASSHDRFGK